MHRLGPIIPLIVGILALAYSYTLSLGRLTDPGPGLWPFLISAAIIVFSLMLLLTERDAEDYERFTSGIRTIALGVLSLAVFIVLFDTTGFIIPALLVFIFWLRFIGGESWRLSISLSLLGTAAVYALFVVLLGVPFPENPLLSV